MALKRPYTEECVTTTDDRKIRDRRLVRRVASIAAATVLTFTVAAVEGMPNEKVNAGPQVTVDNFSFAPAMTTVAVGTTVTWTNHDDIPHNVVSPDEKFKSPVLDTDQSFSHTFAATGTYTYYCSIHPRMTGQVVVR
jgi:plastocyanin